MNFRDRRWLACVVSTALCLTLTAPASAVNLHSSTHGVDSRVEYDPMGAKWEEKQLALGYIGIGNPSDDWLIADDRNFVVKYWGVLDDERWPLTKKAARAAFDKSEDECTAFIRVGAKEWTEADTRNWGDGEDERLREAKAKRVAAVLLKIEPTDELLRLDLQTFIIEIKKLASGTHVKEAARKALEAGTREAMLAFLETGVRAAIQQDSAAEDEAERIRRAKRAAASLFVNDGERYQNLPDDNFIRKVLEWATNNPRIRDAAAVALASSNPKDWREFILTGIYAANEQDKKDQVAKEERANRLAVHHIVGKAKKGGLQPALVEAGEAALRGSGADLIHFLREGRYRHLEQSLEGVYSKPDDGQSPIPGERGYYILADKERVWLDFGDPGIAERTPLRNATWRVIDGLADVNCYSFESADHSAHFLSRAQGQKVSLVNYIDSVEFKQNATWCPVSGLVGRGVSLQSFGDRSVHLRRSDSELFAVQDDGSMQGPGSHWGYKTQSSFLAAKPQPDATTVITYAYLNLFINSSFDFGEPIGSELMTNGVRYRDFRNGRLFTDGRLRSTWNSKASYYDGKFGIIHRGPILDKYDSLGGPNLGFPGVMSPCGDGRGYSLKIVGTDKVIYHTPSTGAHLVLGAIGMHWERLGGIRSYLGYPTSDEERVGNIAKSRFEHGYIEFNFNTGEVKDVRS